MRTIRPHQVFLFVLACTGGLTVDHTLAENTKVEPLPLAVVGEDTLTTTHLKIELAIMKNRNSENANPVALEPGKVLRRLIQNQLVIQEGYRMGLDQDFTVSNQVIEVVRQECMAALLDSVAFSVPDDTPDFYETRRLAVKLYLEELAEKYEASVDSTLLASLDYGSDDPEMQKYLRESKDILAVVPTGQLSVGAFSRIIRYTEFHGLVGKPDAGNRRDDVFREWFAEALLNFQYQAQGMDKNPEIVLLAKRMERNVILEETLGILLKFDFAPTDKEVEDFYLAHLEAVTPSARVKMKSLKASDEASALALYEKILRGTPINWLFSNDPTVVQGPPPFPEEYFQPEQLGLKPEMLEVGYVPKPYQVPTGWVVAVISEVEKPEPAPLASCRTQILGMLKSDQTQLLMVEILGRLEEVSPVEILPGAEAKVATVIQDYKSKGGASQADPVENPIKED